MKVVIYCIQRGPRTTLDLAYEGNYSQLGRKFEQNRDTIKLRRYQRIVEWNRLLHSRLYDMLELDRGQNVYKIIKPILFNESRSPAATRIDALAYCSAKFMCSSRTRFSDLAMFGLHLKLEGLSLYSGYIESLPVEWNRTDYHFLPGSLQTNLQMDSALYTA